MTNDDAPPESDSTRGAPEGAPAPGDVPPSVRIVEAVAEETGRDPTDLPPLHEYVDADALDTLLSSSASDDSDLFTLSFSYGDVDVRVDGQGSIEVDH